jgi:GTP-binding protein EngB required for normal cell division
MGTRANRDGLRRIADISRTIGNEQLAADADALALRIDQGRFFVACVGQFKRGKSTLINALVGQQVLPTGVLPLTSVPTIVRGGPAPAARVRLAASGWRDVPLTSLETYVSEEQNPGNRIGAQAVEVFLPSPLLARGLCLVDTPGLGSVFPANTTATQEFIPHVDATLAVIGADPPLSGEELSLIDAVARITPVLLVVINKADRVSDDERAAATKFAERMIEERIGRSVNPIYQVSATEVLARSGPERDWRRLTAALTSLAQQTGTSLVEAARTRGVARLAAMCQRAIDDLSDALQRPIAESNRRLDSIRRCVADVAHRSLQLGHMFAADEEDLARSVAGRRDAFLQQEAPRILDTCQRRFEALPAGRAPALRRRAVTLAREVAKQALDPWLAHEEARVETEYRELADRFVKLANDFLERLAASGELPVASLPRALPPEAGFRLNRHFYFHDLIVLVTATAKQQWLLDRLRSRSASRRQVWTDTATYLHQLLDMNTTRVQNDLDERVAESRRHLEAEVQTILEHVHVSAEHALVRAQATRAAGARAVEHELTHLDALRHEIQDLQSAQTQAL